MKLQELILIFSLFVINPFFLAAQEIKLSGTISAENNNIVNVADPIDNYDATNKRYVDNSQSSFNHLSTFYQEEVYYVEDDENVKIIIKSSGNAWARLSWSRSDVNLTVTHPSHGLAPGDPVVIRNTNVNKIYAIVISNDQDTFTVEVPNSGATSGNLASYIVAFKTDYTENAYPGDLENVTVSMPLNAINASQKLKSIHISSFPQENRYSIQVPKGLESGAAGEATSFLNFQLPVTTGVGYGVYSELSDFSIMPRVDASNVNSGDFNVFDLVNSDASVGEYTIISVIF